MYSEKEVSGRHSDLHVNCVDSTRLTRLTSTHLIPRRSFRNTMVKSNGRSSNGGGGGRRRRGSSTTKTNINSEPAETKAAASGAHRDDERRKGGMNTSSASSPSTGSRSRKRRHGSGQAQDDHDQGGTSSSTIKQVGGALLVALVSAGIGAQHYTANSSGHHAASPSTGSPTFASSTSSSSAPLNDPQLAALVRQDESWDRTDPTLQNIQTYMSTYVCRHPKGYCHPNLQPVPSRRTHRTSDSGVSSGTVILKLPRGLQIWDLDAMRDEFVRRELLQARHGDTGNPLDSGAYLAAHLVRKRRLAEGEWKGLTAGEGQAVDDPMLPYLQILPTYDDLSQFHPTLWSDSDLLKQLGRFTPSAVLVQAFGDMMDSEYNALCTASKEFASNVSKEDYFAARINVMSRSFGPGPPTISEEDVGRFGSLNSELSIYKEKAGIDLTLGCRAMSPILDTWDSHPHPNAEWNYDAKTRAFVVWASDRWGGIPPYHDVMVSYGKYSDAFLFAKFGYVNGDGTSHTETYINAHHRLLDVGLMQQFSYLSWSNQDSMNNAVGNQNKELLHYLTFDDGYEECIRPGDGSNNPDGWALKQLKYKMLQKIANQRDRWVMQVSPRRGRNQGPGFSSAVQNSPTSPPVFDMRKMRFDVRKLVASCRLITLTDDDYEGQAQSILADALTKGGEFVESFVVEKQSDALEYRAASCISRLVDIMLRRYPSSVAKDLDALSKSSTRSFSREASAAIQHGSKEWYATNVRLGEMQSLEILGGSMMQHARRLRSGMGASSADGGAALIVRRKPCSIEYSLPLLEQET